MKYNEILISGSSIQVVITEFFFYHRVLPRSLSYLLLPKSVSLLLLTIYIKKKKKTT